MQARNLYVIMAREVTTDASDSMNSIIKIIDQFNFNYDPAELTQQNLILGKSQIVFPAKYAVCTSWQFDKPLKKPTKLTFRIAVVDPSGTNLGGPQMEEQEMPAGIARANFNLNVEGMPIVSAGAYKMVAQLVNQAGDVFGENDYPFSVELSEQASKNA